MSSVLFDANAMKRALGRIAHEVLEANEGAENLVVVGILRRGYPIAKRLAFQMTQIEGQTIPCGKIDVRSHRDDQANAPLDESEVPFEVTDKTVLLVDEVIYTGRTIRAALDTVIKFGRPRKVLLAVLIDRGHRELPIQPDYLGKAIATERDDHVIVKVHEIDGEDVVIHELASERRVPV
ncbi:MAG: bifunctional pyr operon transcriptional regulator/uracil phosphoribosyltransferase PyrR [Armatimonadetes bacterium]|nr:bifunctional pyr operon transcriptional regulator/uracil phosphoribosyltransferase PyrR [Armatimonadota bacterium]